MKNTNILIIEDDESSRLFFEKILEKYKYNFVSVSNTEDIYNTIKENSIDMVLLDILITPIDGVTIAKYLRKHMPNIKIIMQTAHTFLKEKENVELYDAFLEKPINSIELIRAIKSL